MPETADPHRHAESGKHNPFHPMHDQKKGVTLQTDSTAKFSPSLDKNIHTIDIGIEEKNRQAVVGLLQVVLANLNVIYVKTRNYHWNITGPRFHTLHLFLEEQYKELAEAADEVAERIRTLGAFSLGTMTEFTKQSVLAEEPGQRPPADGMIGSLLKDHETIIKGLREDIDKCDDDYEDTGTADFLTGLMEQHEKLAWMLRAHLEDHALRNDA